MGNLNFPLNLIGISNVVGCQCYAEKQFYGYAYVTCAINSCAFLIPSNAEDH